LPTLGLWSESGGNVPVTCRSASNGGQRLLSSSDSTGDRERIGIIGVCGWGGMALNAAAVDKRIKAVVTSTIYDMTRVMSKGYNDAANSGSVSAFSVSRERDRLGMTLNALRRFKTSLPAVLAFAMILPENTAFIWALTFIWSGWPCLLLTVRQCLDAAIRRI